MHRMVIVIMPPSEARSPEPYVRKVMEPYEENRIREPWQAMCHCVGRTMDARPRHGCRNCGGQGWTWSTHNWEGQWDRWYLGGVWDGWMVGLPDFYYPMCSNNPYLNMAGGVYVPEKVADEVSAVVLPDGKWHDLKPSQMCFLTMESPTFDTFRTQYLDHVFVICDVHTQA